MEGPRTGTRPRLPASPPSVLLVVPPVLAVGLYFACWHSLCHVVRHGFADPVAARALADRRPGVTAARLARDAAPLSAAALALLGALAVAVPSAPPSVPGVYLALLVALTPAHAVVVGWMDVAGA